MQSSNAELTDEVEPATPADPVPAAPAPLIMIETDDAGVCAVDGECN
jgi:hypothetical protein